MKYQERRLRTFAERIQRIENWLNAYQHSLRAIISSLPVQGPEPVFPELATIGRCDIWPCIDGAVILIYPSARGISISVQPALNKKVDEFLKDKRTVAAYFDDRGQRPRVRAVLGVGDATRAQVHFAGFKIESHNRVFKTRYNQCIIVGWEAELQAPDELAIKDFQQAYAIKNIGGNDAAGVDVYADKEKITSEKASQLSQEYRTLCATATKEEELQIFLRNHPEFIYPDFIECYPKLPLGAEYATDYVLLVQGHQGPAYVFVEIERPDKPLFTDAGHFSHQFTQAKNQLLQWDNWITTNHAYLADKLKGLARPEFHLVMGRSESLSDEEKTTIGAEFNRANYHFSTFDVLADRFDQIVKNTLGVASPPLSSDSD